MYKDGFVKAACVSPVLRVGNPRANVQEILAILEGLDASLAVFPELCITGYTAGDLFFKRSLLDETKGAIEELLAKNPFEGILVVGAPLELDGILYNAAFVVKKDTIQGIVPKMYLPNTEEFYEKRWFKSGFDIADNRATINYLSREIPFGHLVFKEETGRFSFAVEICEDMWAPFSPGNSLALQGARVIVNLSASNDYLHKQEIRRRTIVEHSRKNAGAYVYASAGMHESTSETVFSGHNVVAESGYLLAESESFAHETEIVKADIDLAKIDHRRKNHSSFRDTHDTPLTVADEVHFELAETDSYTFEKPFDKTPFVPKEEIGTAFDKVANLLENALIKRIEHVKPEKLVIGVSGGIDSSLALLVAASALRRMGRPAQDILAVTMPGLGTSDATLRLARSLMRTMATESLEMDIKAETESQLSALGHDTKTHDATFENVQARLRAMTLLNLANKHNGLVIGSADMSELALGFVTYGADHMGMYNINAGLPKTLVVFMAAQYASRRFSKEIAALIDEVSALPYSPELVPGQVSEATLGKYEINDFILERFLRAGDNEERIARLLVETFALAKKDAAAYVENFFRRFFAAQFKRQATPDGPKVLDVSLSARSDFRIPSDISRF